MFSSWFLDDLAMGQATLRNRRWMHIHQFMSEHHMFLGGISCDVAILSCNLAAVFFLCFAKIISAQVVCLLCDFVLCPWKRLQELVLPHLFNSWNPVHHIFTIWVCLKTGYPQTHWFLSFSWFPSLEHHKMRYRQCFNTQMVLGSPIKETQQPGVLYHLR